MGKRPSRPSQGHAITIAQAELAERLAANSAADIVITVHQRQAHQPVTAQPIDAEKIAA